MPFCRFQKCLLDKSAFFGEKVPLCLENKRKTCLFWTQKCSFCRLQKCPFLDKSAFLEYESALLFKKQVQNASIGPLHMTFILKSIKLFFSFFFHFPLFSSFRFFRLFHVLTKGHIQPPLSPPQPKGRGALFRRPWLHHNNKRCIRQTLIFEPV